MPLCMCADRMGIADSHMTDRKKRLEAEVVAARARAAAAAERKAQPAPSVTIKGLSKIFKTGGGDAKKDGEDEEDDDEEEDSNDPYATAAAVRRGRDGDSGAYVYDESYRSAVPLALMAGAGSKATLKRKAAEALSGGATDTAAGAPAKPAAASKAPAPAPDPQLPPGLKQPPADFVMPDFPFGKGLEEPKPAPPPPPPMPAPAVAAATVTATATAAPVAAAPAAPAAAASAPLLATPPVPAPAAAPLGPYGMPPPPPLPPHLAFPGYYQAPPAGAYPPPPAYAHAPHPYAHQQAHAYGAHPMHGARGHGNVPLPPPPPPPSSARPSAAQLERPQRPQHFQQPQQQPQHVAPHPHTHSHHAHSHRPAREKFELDPMDPNPESAQEAWEDEQGARKKFKGFAPRGSEAQTAAAESASAATAAAAAAPAPALAAATAAPAPAAASSKPAVRQATIKPSFVPTSLLVRHRPAAAPAPVARPRAYDHTHTRCIRTRGVFVSQMLLARIASHCCVCLFAFVIVFRSSCAVCSTRRPMSTWALRQPQWLPGPPLPHPLLLLARLLRSPRRRHRRVPKHPARRRPMTNSWRDWMRCDRSPHARSRFEFFAFFHVAHPNS